ncbi:MAG: DegT/DnrJ/EryC1/StrS family aminotransferase [Nibricoccus sp.]
MNNKGELRSRPLPGLGAAAIGDEEQSLVLDVLKNKELFRYYGFNSAKPPLMAATLEKEAAVYFGVKFALAVSSGTAALEVAMGAAGIGPGDEVIIPAWSWISCFTAVVRVGARPVLAEIDASLCLDPRSWVKHISLRTRAVMVIHYQGVAADMETIVSEARSRGLLVIEDCAEAPGAEFGGRKVGAWGDVAIYSFQHNKPMTAGEGGMLVTDSARIYERAVRLHDLGQYRPYHAGIHSSHEPAFAGGQYRMSELTASVALAQFRKLDKIMWHCRALQGRILPRLAGLKGISLRTIPDPSGDFGFEIYFYARDSAAAQRFRELLEGMNVSCQQRTGTYPQYRREYVRTGLAAHPLLSPFHGVAPWPGQGYRAEDFPITEDFTSRFVALPLGWAYTHDDADYIASCVEKAHDEMYPSLASG